MIKNPSSSIDTFILRVLIIVTVLFLLPRHSFAETFSLINLNEGETIDASHPYILQGNQEGISDIRVNLQRIKDSNICHNNGSDPIFYKTYKLATTSTLTQPIDFSSYKDTLSEKISFNISVENAVTGDILHRKTIKFKNVPGQDWCDNPDFYVIRFSLSQSPSITPDGAVASFYFQMLGVEKITMDYGDGIVTDFSTKDVFGNSLGLFPHSYKKSGTYTVNAKLYNYKNDLIEKSLSFSVIIPSSEPNFYLDSPVNGTNIVGGARFDVTWHTANFLSDTTVDIGLYKIDPTITYTNGQSYGARTDLVAVLASNIPNNGHTSVFMPTDITSGEYLIKMYCLNLGISCYTNEIRVQKNTNTIIETKVNAHSVQSQYIQESTRISPVVEVKKQESAVSVSQPLFPKEISRTITKNKIKMPPSNPQIKKEATTTIEVIPKISIIQPPTTSHNFFYKIFLAIRKIFFR